jgi:hypothetical protein
MSPLTDEEMRAFAQSRVLPDVEVRIALAEGSPGIAACLNVEEFQNRRELILAAYECAAGLQPFSEWVQQSESFANSRSEKLDSYLKLAYGVLGDVLDGLHGRPATKHRDVQPRITKLAEAVTLLWLERAVRSLDELVLMVRRNIQKISALDAMIINLRNA